MVPPPKAMDLSSRMMAARMCSCTILPRPLVSAICRTVPRSFDLEEDTRRGRAFAANRKSTDRYSCPGLREGSGRLVYRYAALKTGPFQRKAASAAILRISAAPYPACLYRSISSACSTSPSASGTVQQIRAKKRRRPRQAYPEDNPCGQRSDRIGPFVCDAVWPQETDGN